MNYSSFDPSCGLNRYNNWVPQGCFPGAGELNRRLARPTDYTVQSNTWCAPEPTGGIGIGGVFAALAGVAVLATLFKNRSGGEVSVSKTVRHTVESPASTTTVTTDPKAKEPAIKDKTKDIAKPIAPKTTKTTTKGAVVEEYDGYTVIKKKPSSVTIATDTKDATDAKTITFDVANDDAFVVNGPLHHYKVEDGKVTEEGTSGLYMEGGKAPVRPLADPSDTQFKDTNFAKNNGIMGQDSKGNFFVQTYAEWKAKPIDDAKWAMQNGCILLDKDATGKVADPDYSAYGKEKKIRSAMGYDKDGQLIAITTTKGVSLEELQQLMRDAGAIEAMALDGDSISGHIVDGKVTGTLLDNRPMIHVK